MKRLALVAAITLASGSCEFAHKHPAVTAGIAAGFIGLVPCLPAISEPLKCVEIGAAVGVGIGGFVGLVNLLFDTSEHDVAPDPAIELMPDGTTRVHTTTPPPPGPPPGQLTEPAPDAGVPVTDAASDSAMPD